jgi:hypothetical protein
MAGLALALGISAASLHAEAASQSAEATKHIKESGLRDLIALGPEVALRSSPTPAPAKPSAFEEVESLSVLNQVLGVVFGLSIASLGGVIWHYATRDKRRRRRRKHRSSVAPDRTVEA